MPGADDIADQQGLLAAHRRTLGVLQRQRAALGAAYAPPAVLSGIAEARAAIAAAKAALRGWGVDVEDLPEDMEPPAPAGAESSIASPPRASGDVITANIGAGAQGVAVGKNIHQTTGGRSSGCWPTWSASWRPTQHSLARPQLRSRRSSCGCWPAS